MADKLRFPDLAAIRIPAIIAIALGQAIGLALLVGNRSFLQLLAFSAICAAVNAASLWIDRFQAEGIEPLWVALGSYILVPDSHVFTERGLLYNAFYFLGAGIVLVAAASSLIAQRRVPAMARSKTQDAGLEYRGTLFCAVIALTTFERATDFVGSRHLSLAWSIPVALPVIWYAWMYTSYRIELHRLNPTGNLSILNRND